MLSSAIFIKSNLKCRFLHFTIYIGRSNHTSATSHCRVSRIHQLLSPNPLPCLIHLLQPQHRSHCPNKGICGLGASVGCERIKRTFNTPRLKSQICLIGGNGFVCSVSNELNSNYPNATSSVSISVNPKENNIVPILLCFPADISGISSSTTT